MTTDASEPCPHCGESHVEPCEDDVTSSLDKPIGVHAPELTLEHFQRAARGPEPATRPEPGSPLPWRLERDDEFIETEWWDGDAILSEDGEVLATINRNSTASAPYIVYAANKLPELEEELRVMQDNLDSLTPIVDAGGQLDRLEADLREAQLRVEAVNDQRKGWQQRALRVEADRDRLVAIARQVVEMFADRENPTDTELSMYVGARTLLAELGEGTDG